MDKQEGKDPEAAPAQESSKVEAKTVVSSTEDGLDHSTQVTCDVLCSLMGSTAAVTGGGGCCPDQMSGQDSDDCPFESKHKDSKMCPKQMQLPMFLSKTYHMISRSDPEIAAWSESGDNFVIKNVDKFAASVLPLYFKHSNFSSFARQLNFYGFRKLRSDPILTSDVDPQTAGHVRFHHEKFQRDQPELLQHIKRATKTDQQSKDEMESLRLEVACLRDTLAATTTEYERRLAELSYDFNRRLSATNAEFDNLAAMVHRFLAGNGADPSTVAAGIRAMPGAPPLGSSTNGSDPLHSLSHIATMHQTHSGMRPPPSTFAYPPSLKRPAAEEIPGIASTSPQPASARPRQS